jgi:hypothetical protein
MKTASWSLRSARHGQMGPTSRGPATRHSAAPHRSGQVDGGGEALRVRIPVGRDEGQHVWPPQIDLALHVLGPVGEEANHVCETAVAVGTCSCASVVLPSPSPIRASTGALGSNPCSRRKSSNASVTRASNCSRVVLIEVRTCTVAHSPVLGCSGHTSIERRHRARLPLGSRAIHATLNR